MVDEHVITEDLCRERMTTFANLLEHSMKEVAATSTNILTALDTLNKQLFRDNGGVSLQTRVDRNTRQAAAAVRLTWVVVTLMLTGIVGLVTFILKHMLKL